MTVEDRAWDTRDDVGALSDADLLAAIRQADRGALPELFTRHEPWLSTRLARRCSDPTIVDTAIQETFLAVWRKPNGWRGEGEIPPGRGGSPSAPCSTSSGRAPTSSTGCAACGARPCTPPRRLLARIEHSDVGLAFSGLSPDLQAVVQVTILDGLSTREAASLLGIPSGTVKSRMSRAPTELREALL